MVGLLVQEFINYLLEERHFSRKTSKCYRSDMEAFSSFLLERLESRQLGIDQCILEASTEDIQAFKSELQGGSLAISTCSRRIATLRSFFKFLQRKGKRPDNPAILVKSIKVVAKAPRFMTEEEQKKLFAQPDLSKWFGVRDRAILELLCCTGVRVSELTGLNLSDLELKVGTVRVLGFSKRERVHLIEGGALQALRRYLDARSTKARDDTGSEKPLFVNKDGVRLTDRSIRRKIDIYLEAAKLDMSICPRSMRHFYARRAISGGADPKFVKSQLGLQNTTKLRSSCYAEV